MLQLLHLILVMIFITFLAGYPYYLFRRDVLLPRRGPKYASVTPRSMAEIVEPPVTITTQDIEYAKFLEQDRAEKQLLAKKGDVWLHGKWKHPDFE